MAYDNPYNFTAQDIMDAGGNANDFIDYGYNPMDYGYIPETQTNFPSSADDNATRFTLQGDKVVLANGDIINPDGSIITASGVPVQDTASWLTQARNWIVGPSGLNSAGGLNQTGSNLITSLLGGGASALSSYLGGKQIQGGIDTATGLQQQQLNYAKGIQDPYLQAGTNALTQMTDIAKQQAPTLTQPGLPSLSGKLNLEDLKLGLGPEFKLDPKTQEFQYDYNKALESPFLSALNRKTMDTLGAQNVASGMYGSGNMLSAAQENLMAQNAQYLGQDFGQQQQVAAMETQRRQNEMNLYNQYLQQGYSNETAAKMAMNQSANANETSRVGYSNQIAQQQFQNAQQQSMNQFNAGLASQQANLAPWAQIASMGQGAANALTNAGQNYATTTGGYNIAGANDAALTTKGIVGGLTTAGTAALGAQAPTTTNPQTSALINALTAK